MSFCTQLLRPTRLCSSMVRKFSATAEAAHITDEPFQAFRTLETNPAKHTSAHLNRFYTISPETKTLLFLHGGLPKKFAILVDTFVECSILVRPPAIELFTYLHQTDYTRPPNRYVLYGEAGTGKTLTIAHLLHFASLTKKVIVHVPWVPYWFKFPKEVASSPTREGYYDLPFDAGAWLVNFKHQNSELLSELDLRVSKDYEWSSRESTKSGAPLTEMIDFGISRLKYACDIVYALTEELKASSTAGKCNTLVAIDGFNAFFNDTTRVKGDDKKFVPPSRISLTEAFLNITKYDWCNSAIVVVVDPLASRDPNSMKMEGLPRELIGKEGFEHLDPFLPIKVENYTAEEFETVMEYYKDRKLITRMTKNGQRELELLTARNPFSVMELSGSV